MVSFGDTYPGNNLSILAGEGRYCPTEAAAASTHFLTSSTTGTL